MEISSPTSITIEVSIDKSLCIDCGTCLDLCSMGVFVRTDDGVFPYRSYLCCLCLKCGEFCPGHAISTRWVVRA